MFCHLFRAGQLRVCHDHRNPSPQIASLIHLELTFSLTVLLGILVDWSYRLLSVHVLHVQPCRTKSGSRNSTSIPKVPYSSTIGIFSPDTPFKNYDPLLLKITALPVQDTANRSKRLAHVRDLESDGVLCIRAPSLELQLLFADVLHLPAVGRDVLHTSPLGITLHNELVRQHVPGSTDSAAPESIVVLLLPASFKFMSTCTAPTSTSSISDSNLFDSGTVQVDPSLRTSCDSRLQIAGQGATSSNWPGHVHVSRSGCICWPRPYHP